MRKRSKKRLYTPYLRRGNGREQSRDLRGAIRLAYFHTLGKPYCVMLQRGFRRLVMQVEATKRALKRRIPALALGQKRFKKWATGVRNYAQGGKG